MRAGGHLVGHVAVHEHLSGVEADDLVGRDARVGAPDLLRGRQVSSGSGRKVPGGAGSAGAGAGAYPEELGFLRAGHALEVVGILGESVLAEPGSGF